MGFTTTGGYILGLCRDSSVHTVLLFCPTFRAVPTCRTVMVLAPKDSIRFAVSSQPLDSLPNWLVNGTKVKIKKKRRAHNATPIPGHYRMMHKTTLFKETSSYPLRKEGGANTHPNDAQEKSPGP